MIYAKTATETIFEKESLKPYTLTAKRFWWFHKLFNTKTYKALKLAENVFNARWRDLCSTGALSPGTELLCDPRQGRVDATEILPELLIPKAIEWANNMPSVRDNSIKVMKSRTVLNRVA